MTGKRWWIQLDAVLAALLVLPLHATAKSPPLEEVLERAGDHVEEFWREFTKVSCKETVEQVKLNEKGKTLNRQQAEYDYVIFMQLAGKELQVEESREVLRETRPKKKRRPSQRALLVTSGFPIMKLVFHPNFQNRYAFRLAPEVEEGLQKVEFEQVAGADPLSILRMKDRDYPLAWKGTAWIDPATGIIQRIETRLAAPLTEVGLQSLTSDVQYSETRFQETGITYWLPVRADVEARSAHQHWRNTHEFSGYRQFSVNTAVTLGEAR